MQANALPPGQLLVGIRTRSPPHCAQGAEGVARLPRRHPGRRRSETTHHRARRRARSSPRRTGHHAGDGRSPGAQPAALGRGATHHGPALEALLRSQNPTAGSGASSGAVVKTLAVYNIKGGVGKTSTAVNLGYIAAQRGLRTLLWDLDPQAAATFIFRVRPRIKGGGERVVRATKPLEAALKATDFDGLDLLPADFTYRHMDLMLDRTKRPTRRLERVLEPLSREYDLLVLDCPPSVSLVSENVLHMSDTV